MGLAEEMTAVHGGEPRGTALVGAFRDAVVLVPFDGESALLTVLNGVEWLPVFTTERELAAYVTARGEAGRTWEYRTVHGWRVLDVLVPEAHRALGEPVGVAVDVAGARAVLLPPVAGIVPEGAGRLA